MCRSRGLHPGLEHQPVIGDTDRHGCMVRERFGCPRCAFSPISRASTSTNAVILAPCVRSLARNMTADVPTALSRFLDTALTGQVAETRFKPDRSLVAGSEGPTQQAARHSETRDASGTSSRTGVRETVQCHRSPFMRTGSRGRIILRMACEAIDTLPRISPHIDVTVLSDRKIWWLRGKLVNCALRTIPALPPQL